MCNITSADLPHFYIKKEFAEKNKNKNKRKEFAASHCDGLKHNTGQIHLSSNFSMSFWGSGERCCWDHSGTPFRFIYSTVQYVSHIRSVKSLYSLVKAKTNKQKITSSSNWLTFTLLFLTSSHYVAQLDRNNPPI